ncbi:MAG: ATP-binding protein, partial [Acidobacteriota bacterium]|nr:ATP-binding protein [Acidobacteriota bacterium]
QTEFPEVPIKLREGIERVQLLADQALEQVRAVSHRLYPPDWQQLSLTDAIERLLQSSGVTQTSEVTLEITPFDPEPSYEAKVTLYRCCQECLSNILRHSGAKNVAISLRQSNGRIVLAVEDDGVGFDPGDAAAMDPRARGIGLPAMEEQVRSLGGSLILQSGAVGTRLEFSLPIVEA